MAILLLKLFATPTLIALASLSGRRWGPRVSGWIASIPLTSGPLVLYFALADGTRFAAQASIGIVVGLIAVAAFCLAYGRLATAHGWPFTLVGSLAVFGSVSVVTQNIKFGAASALAVVALALLLGIGLLPRAASHSGSSHWPAWDIPLRMLLATVTVVTLAGLGPILGSRLSGQLAPVPIYAGLMAVFAHRAQSAGAAVEVLRGVLFGVFGFGLFFFVLAELLPIAPLAQSFVAATITCLASQAVGLILVSRLGLSSAATEAATSEASR